MALRDKLRNRSAPFLEPDEQIQSVFLAQTGPTPWLAGAVGILIYAFIAKYRIIVATDHSIVVLKAGAMTPAKPKAVVERLPRNTQLGPFNASVWGKVTLGTERHWVHRRFKKDVEAADAAIGR
jgi:hypothetical protein